MYIVADSLRCFQLEGFCIMCHFCRFLFITMISFCTDVGNTILQAGVQPVLQDMQAPHDQHPLPQQLCATAEQPHVPPDSLYHLTTHQHTQASGYSHESSSKQVTSQGNLQEIV